MRYFNNRRPFRSNPPEPRDDDPETPDDSQTGPETKYMRSLVESRLVVTVVLTTGERFRGRVRYYDRECFSVGPLAGGPNIFVRKQNVHSIVED
jgi:hypothetical protein